MSEPSASLMRRLLVGDTAWPPVQFVAKLIEASDHLLQDHDCDRHGYEEIEGATKSARAWLERLKKAFEDPVEPLPHAKLVADAREIAGGLPVMRGPSVEPWPWSVEGNVIESTDAEIFMVLDGHEEDATFVVWARGIIAHACDRLIRLADALEETEEQVRRANKRVNDGWAKEIAASDRGIVEAATKNAGRARAKVTVAVSLLARVIVQTSGMTVPDDPSLFTEIEAFVVDPENATPMTLGAFLRHQVDVFSSLSAPATIEPVQTLSAEQLGQIEAARAEQKEIDVQKEIVSLRAELKASKEASAKLEAELSALTQKAFEEHMKNDPDGSILLGYVRLMDNALKGRR